MMLPQPAQVGASSSAYKFLKPSRGSRLPLGIATAGAAIGSVFPDMDSHLELFFARQELGSQPAEDIVDDRLCVGHFRVAGMAGRFEADVGELVDEHPERDSVLESERNGGGKGIHESGDGAAFLGHHQEDLARLSFVIHAHGDVTLVPADRELVGDGAALGRQLAAHRAERRGFGRLGSWFCPCLP